MKNYKELCLLSFFIDFHLTKLVKVKQFYNVFFLPCFLVVTPNESHILISLSNKNHLQVMQLVIELKRKINIKYVDGRKNH